MKIKTINLVKNYKTLKSPEVQVLKGINLTINSGETVALTGPSGVGKSTLIHLLGLMDKQTSGSILLDDINVDNLSANQLAKLRKDNIGFIFQFHCLLADFNVLENILIPVWNNYKQKEKTAYNLLDMMGLKNRAKHLPSELSGGEQQRVAMARAFINNPKIIFADEPTGNLDRNTGEKIEKLMFDMCKEFKTTLVVVTHSQELVKLASKQLIMENGKIK
jgi:lipoprotein-releasing system ATP-binding protein